MLLSLDAVLPAVPQKSTRFMKSINIMVTYVDKCKYQSKVLLKLIISQSLEIMIVCL